MTRSKTKFESKNNLINNLNNFYKFVDLPKYPLISTFYQYILKIEIPISY